MKFTKVVLFIMLMTVNVASVYGMNGKPLTQRLHEAVDEQAKLDILQESEDYEALILQEQENRMEALQGVNWSILKNAIANNYLLLINFLIEKNIKLSKFNADDLLNPFMINGKLKRYEIGSTKERDQKRLIEFLISKGMNLDLALCEAIDHKYAVVVEVLIQHGVDVNSKGFLDNALSHNDNDENRSRIINALLQAGANTKLKNSFGMTPEDIVRKYPAHLKQTDWAKRILGNNPLPEQNVCGNPGDNNANDSVFNVIKAHKGFAFVGGVIGVGVVVWSCKKLYAKYQDYKKQQEQEQADSEQAELVAD